MAGISRALSRTVTAAFVAAACLMPIGSSAQQIEQWHGPLIVEGRAFPVLMSAQGRWMNWRDTFGAPRMRLIDGTWKQVGTHQGIDIFSEQGAPIVSMTDGVVENVGWTFYSGLRVGVRGVDGSYYFYAHLSRLADGITSGARAPAGRVLGYMGSSGYGPEGTQDEFAPHLHLGLQTAGGRWINPQEQLVGLFRAYTEHVRTLRDQADLAKARQRALRARLASADPPSPEAVARLIADLDRVQNEASSRMVEAPRG